METSDPILLLDDQWVLLATAPCKVQALEGRAWLRHASSTPVYPDTIIKIKDRDFDGKLLGGWSRPLGYSGEHNTYGRAISKDGAIVVVSGRSQSSSSVSNSINTESVEVEKVATSVCTVNYPTANSIQLNARESVYDGDTVGGQFGRHHYSISTLRNYLNTATGLSESVELVAGANVIVDGDNNYLKSIAGNTWNSWFASAEIIVDPILEDCAVSWAIEADTDIDGQGGTDGSIREMGGLDDNPAQNASYTSGEYMLYQVNATTVYVYEKGLNKGSFSLAMIEGDRLGVRVESGVVSYIHFRGSLETIIYTSSVPAVSPLYFKGTLNRGIGSSGRSVIGDVREHFAISAKLKTVHISGAATELVSSEDIDKLAKLGLTVAEGSTYSLITAEKPTSDRFAESPQYDITHGYSVTDTQTVLTSV